MQSVATVCFLYPRILVFCPLDFCCVRINAVGALYTPQSEVPTAPAESLSGGDVDTKPYHALARWRTVDFPGKATHNLNRDVLFISDLFSGVSSILGGSFILEFLGRGFL